MAWRRLESNQIKSAVPSSPLGAHSLHLLRVRMRVRASKFVTKFRGESPNGKRPRAGE